MRDLIALLCHGLRVLLGHHTPSTGRHTATRLAAPQPAPAVPHPAQPRPAPPHVREHLRPLVGEEVALIRPYLLAHEEQQTRRLRRERRTAAVLADLGIDYDISLAL